MIYTDLSNIRRRYHTLLADPPWPEYGGGKIKRGADRHYPLMKVKDIAAVNVQSLTHDDAHLYLWVTNNYLEAGLQVIKAWGFRYITTITWAKDRIGLGQYFRGQTEHCLFAVRGRLPYKNKTCSTLITAPRRGHSEKPVELYEMIEKVSYPLYLELFARKVRRGWDCFGEELEL